MNLRELAKTIRESVDENGEEIVIIPRHLWQAYVQEANAAKDEPVSTGLSQVERIRLLLEKWAKEPDDPHWWAEFDQFLQDNPVRLGSPEALDWGDE